MKIYDYPKEGTVPLGVHLLQTQQFITRALEMTRDMLPGLLAVQKIRHERYLKRLADPKPLIPDEGIEDEQSMQEPEVQTEQSI